MGGWCDPTESLPPTLQPVIVYGVLDGESTPDSHEGYWNGDLWKSIRRNEDDHHLLDIEPVMLWTPMPKPPINAQTQNDDLPPKA